MYLFAGEKGVLGGCGFDTRLLFDGESLCELGGWERGGGGGGVRAGSLRFMGWVVVVGGNGGGEREKRGGGFNLERGVRV